MVKGLAMKRLGKIILASIAAVMALYGCAKENLAEKTPSSDGEGFHLTFTAEKADDDVLTRAAINEENNTIINWSEDRCRHGRNQRRVPQRRTDCGEGIFRLEGSSYGC